MWESISGSRYFIKWAFTIYVGTYYLDTKLRVREGFSKYMHKYMNRLKQTNSMRGGEQGV